MWEGSSFHNVKAASVRLGHLWLSKRAIGTIYFPTGLQTAMTLKEYGLLEVQRGTEGCQTIQ